MKQRVEYRAVGHPLGIARRVAIQRILADIEEERRQVLVAEVAQRADVGVEIEVVDRLFQRRVELGEQRQHVAFQLGHFRDIDALGLVEPVERAQQVAEGVA